MNKLGFLSRGNSSALNNTKIINFIRFIRDEKQKPPSFMTVSLHYFTDPWE